MIGHKAFPPARLTAADYRRQVPKPSKYRNRKVVKGGVTFDSVREYERFLVLTDMHLKRGEIGHLARQQSYDLIVNGVKVGKYVADFTYTTATHFVVEDVKGFQGGTPLFKLKWKLMQAIYREPHWKFVLS